MSTSLCSPQAPARQQDGFSLSEMLVTLLLVTLLTASIATGVSFAQRQYRISLITSESKVLYSTLENILRNELSYADDLYRDVSGTVWFTSKNYADEGGASNYWRIAATSDGSVADQGELALVRADTSPQLLLASTAYTYGMTAGVTVTAPVTGEGGYVRVLLTIYDNKGSELIEEAFDVRPLNVSIDTRTDLP